MVLDTGTAGTILDDVTARQAGFTMMMIHDLDKPPYPAIAGEQVLRFAGLQVHEPSIPVHTMQPLSQLEQIHLDGILGAEFFMQYVVEIDYQASELSIFDPRTYTYSGRGEVLPINYGYRLPIVQGSVTPCAACLPLPTRFQVDTGLSETDATFWRPFVVAHHLLSTAWNVERVSTNGLTNVAYSTEGHLTSMRVGALEFPSPLIGFMQSPHGDPSVFGGEFDANLGTAFLRRFLVIFDLPHNHLILAPPKAPQTSPELLARLRALQQEFAAIPPLKFVVLSQ